MANTRGDVNYKFTPGDLVKVRSLQGPDMLVREAYLEYGQDYKHDRKKYSCAWFEGGVGWYGKLHDSGFYEEELELSSSYEFLSIDDEIL